MRQFVIVGHDVPTTADFSLDDLPGAGRLDVLCRAVTASLLLSHGIRDDVRVHLVVDDALTIQFDGGSLRGLHPDERSTAARVRDALAEREEAIGHVPVEISPGVQLIRVGFETTVDELASEGTVCLLHEDGNSIADCSPPESPVFVLSDNQDFTAAEQELLTAVADRRLRLGPERLHADQAITVAHNWLDTSGFSAY